MACGPCATRSEPEPGASASDPGPPLSPLPARRVALISRACAPSTTHVTPRDTRSPPRNGGDGRLAPLARRREQVPRRRASQRAPPLPPARAASSPKGAHHVHLTSPTSHCGKHAAPARAAPGPGGPPESAGRLALSAGGCPSGLRRRGCPRRAVQDDLRRGRPPSLQNQTSAFRCPTPTSCPDKIFCPSPKKDPCFGGIRRLILRARVVKRGSKKS